MHNNDKLGQYEIYFWEWVLKYDLNERKTEIMQREIEKNMQSFAGKNVVLLT